MMRMEWELCHRKSAIGSAPQAVTKAAGWSTRVTIMWVGLEWVRATSLSHWSMCCMVGRQAGLVGASGLGVVLGRLFCISASWGWGRGSAVGRCLPSQLVLLMEVYEAR